MQLFQYILAVIFPDLCGLTCIVRLFCVLQFKLMLADDGSGQGAALVAAIADKANYHRHNIHNGSNDTNNNNNSNIIVMY